MQNVEFRTHDGVAIRGWYVGSRNGAAILLGHGSGANRAQLLPEARLLHAQGYGILAFDFRAHGESGGDMTTFGDRERQDVLAALDFVTQRPGIDPQRLGALGLSMGAPPIALVAADDRRLRAVVLEGVTSSLTAACIDEAGWFGWILAAPVALTLEAKGIHVEQVDVALAASRLAPRPLLLVQGEREDRRLAARMREVYASAKEPKRYLVIPNAGHGGYMEADPEQYSRELVAFFAAALRTARADGG